MRVKGGKWTAQLYNPVKDEDGRPLPITYWRDAIERQAKPYAPADPWTVPVRVDLVFYFERPQYMLEAKWPNGPILHTGKPDRDNLDKPILDVMAWDEERRWGFWKNDSHVCDGRIQKFYAARGCGPGAEVTITLLEEPEPTLTFAEHKRTHVGGYKLAQEESR